MDKRQERVNLRTDTARRLECEQGKQQTFYRDIEQRGLALRVTASGNRAYVYEGKLEGKNIRVTIGDPVNVTIKEARAKAAEIRQMILQGRDPRIVKAERTAADTAKRQKAKAAAVQAINVWPVYLEHCSTRQKKPWSARTLLDHERLSAAGGQPRKRGKGMTQPGALRNLLELPLSKIDAGTIEAWLKENSYRPAVAEFGYVRLKAFINWCSRRAGYREQVDPMAFKADAVRDQVPEIAARLDILDASDLAAWFTAVRGLANPYHAVYLQIMLLIGCRRGELAPLRWDDVNFRQNLIHLTGKTGSRVIPLTPYVRALLLDLKHHNGSSVLNMDGTRPDRTPSPFVFPSTTAVSGHIQEPRHPHEMALKAAGLTHVSVHGLRRTFGSLSDSEGVDLPHGVVLQIQGHKSQGTAQQHYRVRKPEMLAPWHNKYEKWLLEQAGIEQPTMEEVPKLRAITAA